MGDIVISLSTDLITPLLLLLATAAVLYLGIKLKRLPHDIAGGLARGVARIAKQNPDSPNFNYAEAYTQLSESIEDAWETKDPSHLFPLIGNPLVHAAYKTVYPGLQKFLGGMGGQQSEETTFA